MKQAILWQKLDSSMIAAVRFDPDTNTLEVQFSRGSVYRYSDVPVSIYEGLTGAGAVGSVGAYFTENVKGNYAYEKIS